ncbi:MAG: DUF3363 domain-containing protein [Geobacter sp.]|nr:MAG: DUF3363 domain-containing protein [Geobacter sp.]
MPRIIKIHEKPEDNSDITISLGRTKKRVTSDAGLHYKTSASALFLREMVRTVKQASRRHTGKHRFVRNASEASQRVIVKSRIVRHISAKNGLKSLQDHCSYFTRKGVEGIDQNQPKIYNKAGSLDADLLDEWQQKAAGDRHHFRFIVSPENSQNLDLTSYTRDLVAQLESDLGTRLDSLAVNHFNTDTPHAHIIIRGVSEDGKDLVISRDYIANGVRNRAREIANEHLGLRTELEIKNGITREIARQAFTHLDRELKTIATKSPDNAIDLRVASGRGNGCTEFKRVVQLQRLKFLESLQLAGEIKPGVWKLQEDFEKTLRELGMKNDIIKTMHQSLSVGNNQEKQIFDPQHTDRQSITGVVVASGLADELHDKKYLVVSATDNRVYYVPLSQKAETPGREAKPGAIVTVSISGRTEELRVSDQKILELAAANDGIYSREKHRLQVNKYRLPEGVTVEKYLENYHKRLQALERRGVVKRVGENSWSIPADLQIHLQEHGEKHLKVTLESAADLDAQITSTTPTWLDRELAAGRVPCGDFSGSSFNQELNRAKERRIETLLHLGIASKTAQGITLKRDFLEKLNKSLLQKDMKTAPIDKDRER